MDAHSRCASELLLGRRRCLGDEGLRLGNFSILLAPSLPSIRRGARRRDLRLKKTLEMWRNRFCSKCVFSFFTLFACRGRVSTTLTLWYTTCGVLEASTQAAPLATWRVSLASSIAREFHGAT